jgi:hypothetical protein
MLINLLLYIHKKKKKIIFRFYTVKCSYYNYWFENCLVIQKKKYIYNIHFNYCAIKMYKDQFFYVARTKQFIYFLLFY